MLTELGLGDVQATMKYVGYQSDISVNCGVRVSHAVRSSPEWQSRITGDGFFRQPSGWRWAPRLTNRADWLDGTVELAFCDLPKYVPFSNSEIELRCVREFVRKSASTTWCYNFTFFDADALREMPMSTSDHLRRDLRQPRDWSRDEGRWSHDWQVIVCGVQREGAVLTEDAVWRNIYPAVPNFRDSF